MNLLNFSRFAAKKSWFFGLNTVPIHSSAFLGKVKQKKAGLDANLKEHATYSFTNH